MNKNQYIFLEIHGTETNFGGASNGTKILFDELTIRGEKIFLCHSKKNHVLNRTIQNDNKIFLNFTTKNPFKLLRNLFKLNSFIQDKKINIIHTHHRNDTIYSCLVKLFNKHLKIHYTVHGPSVSFKPNSIFYIFLHKLFLVLSNSFVDNIIYISEFTKDKVQDSFSNIKNFKVIYNGTPTPIPNKSKLEIRKNIGVKIDSFVISIIGGIEGYKRPDLVIEIAELVKHKNDIYFVFVGDGSDKKNIKKLVSQKKLTNIIYIGVVNDIGNYINSSDLIISTAIGEGFGRTIIEAMSLSKPVISFNNGGPKEIIKNKYNGFLIDNFDIDEYSKCILKLYTDKKLAKFMGLNGRELYLKKFQSDLYTENYLREFKSL